MWVRHALWGGMASRVAKTQVSVRRDAEPRRAERRYMFQASCAVRVSLLVHYEGARILLLSVDIYWNNSGHLR